MSSKFNRKPVAVAAIVASSIGSALAAGGAAHATTFGGAGANPVTITAGGAINVVGGGTVALPAGAHDVSWAGQGGRFAFIGADNSIWTADFDGTHGIKIAQGVAPSHTVWDVSSEVVYWTEGSGATAKVVGALANGDSLGSQHPTFDLVPSAIAPAGLGLSNADAAGDLGSSVVVQTTDGSGDNGIGLLSYGSNGQPAFTAIVAPDVAAKGGTTPTISADGKTVVFVRTDANGDAQLFATSLQGSTWSTPKQITWMTGNHATPVFEASNQPDTQAVTNLTVAFEFSNRAVPAGGNANGTYQVDVAQALAAASPAPQLEKSISTLSGGLAVRTDNPGRVVRFAGADRIDTAVLASRQTWRTAAAQNDGRQQAKSVVLSRSDLPADALGGAALAAHKRGPLLLTDSKALNAETLGEIRRILPTPGTVYILGGTTAISPAVQTTLTKLGYTVDRIAGQDRYETAVKIANTVDPNAAQVLVATGTNYPDALSAGAAAGSFDGTVVVLTNGATMPAATDAFLQSKISGGKQVFMAAVGGDANKALKSAKWTGYDALVGTDRYQTSYLVAHEIFGTFGAIGVATGTNWPDSLSGGALMGNRQGPLLLVDPKVGLTAADNALIDANRGASNWAYVFGGTSALPLRVDQELAADVATASGSTVGSGHSAATHLSTPNVAKG